MKHARQIATAGALLACLSCHGSFDDERRADERGTLGEEIYEVFCKRMAGAEVPDDLSGEQSRALCENLVPPDAAPTPRLEAMAENRDRIVAALDRTLPATLEDDLNDFMLRLIPFYDPPTEQLPSQTRALGNLLADIAGDDEAIAALERLSERRGYRPARLALGVARPVMAYPNFRELTDVALDTIDEGGSAGEEWDALLKAVALDLATAAPSPPEDGPGTLELTRQLLLTDRAEFGSGPTRLMTLRDARGIAIPFSDDGSVPPPFVDMDRDGLADIDVLGRYIGSTGELLEVPAPFAFFGEDEALRDPIGRAVRADLTPLYTYRNINQSMLAGLAREMVTWLDPAEPTLMDMAVGVPLLLGPPIEQTESLGEVSVTYNGFDTSEGPLFDLVYGVGVLLERDETDEALTLVDALLENNEPEVAAVIDAGLIGDRVADATPSAVLAENSELWDDVLRVGTWIAQEPELLEALLRSLADPRAKHLGTIYGELMRHKDAIAFNAADINASLGDQFWTEEVDHSSPETDDNMSLFQGSISIIHDLEGVRVCNKDGARLHIVIGPLDVTYPLFGGTFDECELLEIENVAEAFAQSIIGRYTLEIKDGFLNILLDVGSSLGINPDRVLEESSGIDGLTRQPTPQALNRLLFGMEGNRFLEALIDPPVTRDGAITVERHRPVTLAWEREFRFCDDVLVSPGSPCSSPETITFFEAMQPLLEAFDTYDRRTEGRFLFSELITSLHTHWPSDAAEMTQDTDPSAPFFANHDNGRSYEPIVSALFANCVWEGSGTSRRCTTDNAGQMVSRLHELLRALDELEVRPGVDGIDVLADASLSLIDPNENVGLVNRAGESTSATNDGSRNVDLTPLLILLDALRGFDDAFKPEPERLTRWRAGRSTIVDQLMTIRQTPAGFEMANRRTYGLLRELVPFVQERIADHEARGDRSAWALGLAPRMEASMGSAVGATSIAFLEAINNDEAAEAEISALAEYLMNEESTSDAFDTTVLATADLMQILDDEDNLDPLFRALSEGIVPDVRTRVAEGGTVRPADLDVTGSALDETLTLVREIAEVDDNRTLTAILSNAVALPEGSLETPLETLIDAMAEINRVEPNSGGPMRADDHRDVLNTATEFMLDEDRGLERIFDVVQNRTIE